MRGGGVGAIHETVADYSQMSSFKKGVDGGF